MRRTTTWRARVAAVATTLGLATTGALVAVPPAQAALTETNFGFQATAYGTRALAQQEDLNLARTAFSYIYCTRLAGRTVDNSLLESQGLPLNSSQPLVFIDAVTSRTRSYRDLRNKIAGASQGTATVGKLRLGGVTPEMPTLSIDGLKTTSTAWATTDGKLHSRNDVSAGELSLDLGSQGAPLEDSPLGDLFDAVNSGASGAINQVIDVLSENLGGIEIPGLGRISLLEGFDRKGANSLTAYASSFLIRVNLYGEDMEEDTSDDIQVNVGRSWARITKGVRSGVMAGVGVGFSEVNRGGLGGSGDVAWKQLPCEGTRGKVRTRSVRSTDAGSNPLQPSGTATGLSGSSYGVQQSGGRAYGWNRGRVNRFVLGDGDLVLEGVVGRTNVRQGHGGGVTTTFTGSRIDRILVNGKVKARDVTPGNASRVRLGSIPGVEKIRFFVRDKWQRGGHVTAVKLTLTEPLPIGTSTADLGFARTAIKRY
jgi:hypothetical protein